MASTTVIWVVAFLNFASAQQLSPEHSGTINGVCRSIFCNKIEKLPQLSDCVVILGNLHILLMEQAHKDDFRNMSFPKLKEVSGYVVFYRVNGLESLGQLFPNLSIIRGKEVVYDYALIIFDMPDLKEVGLYSLMRIYRGGVIVWTVPQICYVHTINWKVIAPQARHVLASSEGAMHCNSVCSCTTDVATNHCWNIKKCQRYLEGPDKEKCNDVCLGCRNVNPNLCTNCRYRTYRDKCLTKCPVNTLVVSDIGYCVTEPECRYLAGWKFKNSCVFNCTAGYKAVMGPNGYRCMPCNRCEETCGNLTLHTLAQLQEASRCVKVNGTLIIHVRFLPDVMTELKRYLGQIEEVSDYVVIYGMPTVTSLEFLPSLRLISGRILRNKTYSLLVYDMISLQSLFTENVTKKLIISNGTMLFNSNPMLCSSELEKIKHLFPKVPGPADVPPGANGYSGGCTKASVGLHVTVINETSIAVNFTHVANPDAHYAILYMRLPQGSRKIFVPETCSDNDWYAYNIPNEIHNNSVVKLTELLQPASSYALCVEKYDPLKKILARSGIVNFSTPVGKPEPPFILELVASSSEVVVLRWVDHKVYRPHITRYEIDVTLVEIYPQDVMARDHCKETERYEEIDIFRHAVVMRPPPDYDRGCESMCGILSTVTAGAMVEEYFDVCSSIELGCNNVEAPPPTNTSFGKFLRTLSLNIKGPRNDFQVGGLAPFRDYRFRLRACSGNQCSRSARGVVRTLRADYADMPTIVYASANEYGFISIKWDPPEITNGPVLSYTVQVSPSVKIDDRSQLIPQLWCQAGHKTYMIVKSVKVDRYIVRVCATTLASRNVCSKNVKVTVFTNVSWWAGIIFGIVLFTITAIATCFWKKQRDISYDLPLLSNIVATGVSEPPSSMISDFIQLYSIPIRDTELD
ncbi:unnamed protein product [Diatraea saccharalis]|uniref:Fibronectin type-III domain-containing protein n=1 Tax=Diatraea saccharalis TaxID=40085 RepID=A0A9N9R1X8_9NEOP|nr:unnamed protein product [Diatraea saccharalis]